MKNIHLLKTSKPSKILKDLVDKTYQFKKDATFGNRIELPLNIYITNEEKFVRDEYITDGIEVIKATPKLVNTQGLVDRRDWKKIILTTDQDLIQDGVQPIDDEFLQWFVNNSSCEEVKVEINSYIDKNISDSITFTDYKIIIPKEEPKQETLENDTDNEEWGFENFITSEEDAKIFIDTMIKTPEPNEKLKKAFREYGKQETLEEASLKYCEKRYYKNTDCESFIVGAKWQQEQYEILFDEYHEYTVDSIEVELKRPLPFKNWFKKFKNK